MAKGKKTGGRAKGTPNHDTATFKEFLNELITSNRGKIKKDLKSLSPKDRLIILEKFMAYCYPKPQAIDIQGTAEIRPPHIPSLIIEKVKEPEQ